MIAKYVLALDAGTSAIRCLVFNLHGQLISACRQSYSYRCPAEIAPLGKEFDPAELWKATCDCIAGAIRSAKISPQAIAGISATSQREGVVFLDKAGLELYAGPNIDLRAVTEGLVLDNHFAEKIYRITGHLPSLMFAPARLNWFRRNRPELYSNIRTVLPISNWLAYRLCGVKAGEICSLVEVGLADADRRRYSSELLELLDIPSAILPELIPSGLPLGAVTAKASEETGIAEGTPVVQGAPDSHCGLIAMGIMNEGQAGIISGWSSPLQMVTAKPVFASDRNIWTDCHISSDRWILESNPGESGHALEWVRERLFYHNGGSIDETYTVMDKLALSSSIGAEGVLAFTGPEAMNTGNLSLRWGGFIFPIPFSATILKAPIWSGRHWKISLTQSGLMPSNWNPFPANVFVI
jgi:autoinducer 2 (AI-2) kinase